MSIYNPRLFRHVESLKTIRPSLLIPFFTPYADYLKERGCELPKIADAQQLDYDKLHAALMAPADKAPDGLAEALYIIDEIDSDKGRDAIRAELKTSLPTFAVDPAWSAAELAIAVWITRSSIVEDAHARLNAFEPRKFTSWRALVDVLPDPPEKMEEASAAIAAKLETAFQEADLERSGAGQPSRRFRLFHYVAGKSSVRFLIRHAGSLQNAPSVREDGSTYLALFRPEIYDVVIYDREACELRVNAGSKLEKSTYARVFGEKLCGHEEVFVEVKKYTLEPLRTGPESLLCAKVTGIKSIRLTELHFDHGGKFKELEIRRATDLFKTDFYKADGFPGVPFTKATFKVKFTHTGRTRTVIVTPPRDASFTRDSDGEFIEEWLRERKFIVKPEEANVDESTPAD